MQIRRAASDEDSMDDSGGTQQRVKNCGTTEILLHGWASCGKIRTAVAVVQDGKTGGTRSRDVDFCSAEGGVARIVNSRCFGFQQGALRRVIMVVITHISRAREKSIERVSGGGNFLIFLTCGRGSCNQNSQAKSYPTKP